MLETLCHVHIVCVAHARVCVRMHAHMKIYGFTVLVCSVHCVHMVMTRSLCNKIIRNL